MPHRLIGTVRFFDRAEIKDILSYVRMVSNHRDTVSFERVINVPKVASLFSLLSLS
jgi:DNA helicase-2/ATP-dependent DNA helicase PcrA